MAITSERVAETRGARAGAIAERLADVLDLEPTPPMAGLGDIDCRLWLTPGAVPIGSATRLSQMTAVVVLNLGDDRRDGLSLMLWPEDDGSLGVCAGWPRLHEPPFWLRDGVRAEVERVDAITDGALRAGLGGRRASLDDRHLLRLLDGMSEPVSLEACAPYPELDGATIARLVRVLEDGWVVAHWEVPPKRLDDRLRPT